MTRRRLLGLALLAALVLVGGGFAVLRPWEPEKPVPPTLTFTQDAEVVRVRLHNENSEWGLRNQRVRLHFRSENGTIRTFGYDMEHTVIGKPGVKFNCCLIASLPPDGDFTFYLPAPDVPIHHIEVKIRGQAHWVRM